MQIRKITVEDIGQLQSISKQTFTETFASENSEENMNDYLENGFSREKLISELLDNNSEFYFAEINGMAIGYLKINYGLSQTELKAENSLELERIYVLKEFQGNKIGRTLFEKTIDIAKEKGVDYVWLGVWEHNHRAIQFYKKNGFIPFDRHIFNLGNDEQTDIMMKLEMKYR